MGVGAGLYMYHVVIKRSCSLSHLMMSSCKFNAALSLYLATLAVWWQSGEVGYATMKQSQCNDNFR